MNVKYLGDGAVSSRGLVAEIFHPVRSDECALSHHSPANSNTTWWVLEVSWRSSLLAPRVEIDQAVMSLLALGQLFSGPLSSGSLSPNPLASSRK